MIIKLALSPKNIDSAKKIPINMIDKSEILLDTNTIDSQTFKKIVNYLKEKSIGYVNLLKINISIIMYRDTKQLDTSEEYIEGEIIEGIEDKLFEYNEEFHFNKKDSYIDEIAKKLNAFVKLTHLKTSKSKYRLATLNEALHLYSDAEKRFIEIIKG